MSKVKIQGHASGTGVLTVTAPNTSTDRTITLPDATGTLATTADSVGGANGVDFNDNVKARFGTGNDFAIWHDGSHTRFQNDTGNLNVRANVFNVTKSDDSENIILAEADGDVKLYRNNAIHLETLATGVRVPVGGVLFGTDTAAANALDDYEEDTWTPSLQLAPSGVTMGTIHVATYTKIGNRVHLTLACNLNSSSSPAPNNDMRMAGFPFPFADSGDLFNATLHANYKETPQLFMNGNRYFYFQSTTVGGNNQSPIGGGLDSVSTLGLCMTYRTTS
jgi:hypothetical protein